MQIMCQATKLTDMKKRSQYNLPYFLAGTCLLIFLSACKKENTKTYTLRTPVFKAKTEVLAQINGNPAEAIEATGKIYIKDNYIFLNEVDKGIHIIDNSNAANPVQIAFLNIPGNQDMAVKGNILYADMYSDLLAMDISNPQKIKITSRISGFFKDRMYVSGMNGDTSQIIASWIEKDTTVPIDNYPVYEGCWNCGIFLANAAAVQNTKGTAGSMARMILVNDYLYAITEPHSVGIVNTSTAEAPSYVSELYAGFDLQTIYPFANKLFLGSASGMYMYDISDPANPAKLGEFSHGRACDPVIADGGYAFVTLHAGTSCGGEENELNVLDINNIMNPVLIKVYSMTKPTGLSKDGDLLFVCDGPAGVKIFDVRNVNDMKVINSIKSDEPYDVITGNNRALVVAKDGLYQYDYSSISKVKLLSFFATKK